MKIVIVASSLARLKFDGFADDAAADAFIALGGDRTGPDPDDPTKRIVIPAAHVELYKVQDAPE